MAAELAGFASDLLVCIIIYELHHRLSRSSATGGKAKHREIYEYIHRAIMSGELAVGDRIPTEMELAGQFHASRVTVARALRELEHQGLLIRRRGAGSFVSQGRNPTGKLLAMVSADAPGQFTVVTDVIVRLAQESGLGVLLGRQTAGDAAALLSDVESLCEQHASGKVAGVFFVPMEAAPQASHVNEQVVDVLARARIPVVLLDRDVVPYPRRSQFDLVGIDHVNAGFQLTDHLLSLGYRRIGFLRHDQELPTITARVAGYREALMARGIEPDAGRIARGDASDPEFVRRYLQRIKPDAVVCVNDHEAARLMRTLAGLSVRVPSDLAVVGMDNDKWATFLSVSLTTLRLPWAEVGAAAMRLMLDRIAEPSRLPTEVSLTCELIVRESSGASPGGTAALAGDKKNELAAR